MMRQRVVSVLAITCLTVSSVPCGAPVVAEAAASKSESFGVEAAGFTQAGGKTSGDAFGMRVSMGEPFASGEPTTPSAGSGGFTETIRTIISGFIGVIFKRFGLTRKDELDITILYAKEDPFGDLIEEATWQRDADPIFIWDPPLTGAELAGYSYAIDEAPDDDVDTTGTSFNVATELSEPLADGVHTFAVKAIDLAGLTGEPLSFEIWVDTTPPQIAGYAPTPGALLSTASPAISATVSDAHSGVDAQALTLLLNGSSVATTYDAEAQTVTPSGSVTFTEGSNSLELRVTDAVGNALAPLVWGVTVDTTPPSGSVVINGGAGTTTSVYVTLGLSATDATSGIAAMRLSNEQHTGYVREPFTALRELWPLDAVQGLRRVYVTFVDTAGNESSPVSDDIELILLAPDTLITSGPAGYTWELSATFTFMCPEGGCVFSYAFDNDDWSEWSSTAEASRPALTAGNHYFRVKAARDSNGVEGIQPEEEDPTPEGRTWIITLEAPALPIPMGPPIKSWRIE